MIKALKSLFGMNAVVDVDTENEAILNAFDDVVLRLEDNNKRIDDEELFVDRTLELLDGRKNRLSAMRERNNRVIDRIKALVE